MKREKEIKDSVMDMEGTVIELRERKSNFIFDKKTADLCFLIIENHSDNNEKDEQLLF